MPESARDLLRRDFAELLAGTRENWSARAVVQANRMLRGSNDREGLWHTSEGIRRLESRVWLLDHFLTEADSEQREREERDSAETCRWCPNPALALDLCTQCRGTVAGERARLADQAREYLAEIDSGLLSRLFSVFVPEVRALRRTVAQADAVERRHAELRRAHMRRAARERS